jgi:hypothetical protein
MGREVLALRLPSALYAAAAAVFACAVFRATASAADDTPSISTPTETVSAMGEAPTWIRELPGQVLAWLETIQHQPAKPEEPWGLFTFSRDCRVPYSVYATSAAWGIAHDCGGIERLPGYTPEAKARMAKFVQGLQDPSTGLFSDPNLEAVRGRKQGLDRFRAAVTKYAINLLTYCGAKPLYPYSSGGAGGKFDPVRYLAETKQGNWDEPWAIGSHSGYQTLELYRLVNKGHPEYLPALKEGVEFILSKQNPKTGMWGRADLPLDQQLGGALKVIGRFQFGMGLIVPHMDRLADSLIANHRSRAFYAERYDATIPRNVAELAYACSEASDYRKAELLEVLRQTAEELRAYRQPDGGFAQRRSGTAAVWWNDAEAVPASDAPRSDIHGTQACLYAVRNICEWTGWTHAPWPRAKPWRQELAERHPTCLLHVDESGKVVVERSGQ